MRFDCRIPEGLAWPFSAALLAGSLATSPIVGELLPAGPPALWAESAWRLPASYLPGLGSVLAWDAPWCIFLGSLVIAIVGERFAAPKSWERLALIAGLSLLLRPQDLICAAILTVGWSRSASTPARPKASRPPKSARLLIAAGLGVLLTLEFGIILYGVLIELIRSLAGPREGRASAGRALCLLSACFGLLAWLFSGFTATALRPIASIWLSPDPGLLPSLTALRHHPSWWFPAGLIGFALLAKAHAEPARLRPWSFVFLVWLAAGSQRWTGLWLLLLSLWHADPEGPALPISRPRIVHRVATGLAVLWAAWTSGLGALWSGTAIAERLDPARWNASGVVILTNLDRAPEWRVPERRERFMLLADDRWDTFPARLNDYAALCRDFTEVRDHAYWRADGRWGGYKAALSRWSPALLTVEIDHHEGIRGLSLSPDWRVMGLDGQQAIFGRVGVQELAAQNQHANNSLLTLEWPARMEQLSLDNTIVTADQADDRAVAAALCALRFPYAALRFARRERSDAPVRARCLLELAHRAAGHSTGGSLLDQYRAIIGARAALARTPSASHDPLHLRRGLEGLLSRRLAAPNWVQSESEQRLRRALHAGETAEAQAALPALPPSRQAYYQALLASPYQSVQEVVLALQNVLSRSQGEDSEYLAEVEFQLGCAALEAGQIATAITAFASSLRLDPDAPHRELLNIHVKQLSR